MSIHNATEVCNNMLSVCNVAFANSTYCTMAKDTIDSAHPALQNAICWTGTAGSGVVKSWLWTFHSVGHYGSYLGDWGGVFGQAAWVFLSGAVAKAALERICCSRNKEVTSQTTFMHSDPNTLKELLKELPKRG